MTKEIKTIKCPQCGSPYHTEIAPDSFVCSNCNAKYYLDDNAINININYKNIPNKPTSNIPSEKSKHIGAIIIAVLIGIGILSSILINLINRTRPQHDVASGYSATAKPSEFEWTFSRYSFFESAAKQPVIMVVGIYDAPNSHRDANAQIGFYEMQNGKLIKRENLNIPIRSDSDSVKIVNFDNGDVYCILNKKQLFKLDRQYLKLTEVSPDAYKDIAGMSFGIAQIEEARNEDGFNVLTNDGMKLCFFPAINRAYNYDKHYEAQGGFKNIPANTPIKTAYAFTRVDSIDFSNEKIQLIKYGHRNPDGYPRSPAVFCWSRDYGRSGIFTERDPYKRVLISSYQKKHCRVVSFVDFTPGRLYFDSRVLAYNYEVVLIAFRASAAPDAPASIQALDAHSAKILWTTPIENDAHYENAFISGVGYFLMGNQGLFLDKKGKVMYKFKP